MTKLIFDLEGRDKECAFFAMYAGLRMYKQARDSRIVNKDQEFSIASAEAGALLNDMKEQYPEQFKDAQNEFEGVYSIT